MSELYQMKGLPTPIITVMRQNSALRLTKYADGSLGINRDNLVIGVWEPSEREDCLRSFARLVSRETNGRELIPHQPPSRFGNVSFTDLTGSAGLAM